MGIRSRAPSCHPATVILTPSPFPHPFLPRFYMPQPSCRLHLSDGTWRNQGNCCTGFLSGLPNSFSIFRKGLKRSQVVSPPSIPFPPPPSSPPSPPPPPTPLGCLRMLWDELIWTCGFECFWLLVIEPFSSSRSLPHWLLLNQTERGGGDGSGLICWLVSSAPASRPSSHISER